MRVLVTGGAGLLGGELLRRAPAWASTEATVFHRPVSAADVRTHVVDLAQRQAFFEVAERRRPDLVIHTAYSKTDHRATVDAATEVATVCAALDVALVHISSDAVFDGDHAPYSEHDEPAPVHAYGRAKHAAETAVVTAVPAATVVRTSLILAADGTDQTSAWAIERLQAGEPVTFFDDEFRMPIFVDDLAEQIWEVASRDAAEARRRVASRGPRTPQPRPGRRRAVRAIRPRPVARRGGERGDDGRAATARPVVAVRPRRLTYDAGAVDHYSEPPWHELTVTRSKSAPEWRPHRIFPVFRRAQRVG
ncbi:MAG: sugar nucleotide-binding protein [Actinobacteria bacterium]|nr:sugar nucleotide-binding protein [Actinomycetota bacterium]